MVAGFIPASNRTRMNRSNRQQSSVRAIAGQFVQAGAKFAAKRIIKTAFAIRDGTNPKKYSSSWAPWQKKPQKNPKKKGPLMGRSTGFYAGKFAKGTRKQVNTSVDKYAQAGVVNVREISGSVTDGDIVYLSHCTFEPELVSKSIAEALVRKLLVRAGIDVLNPDLPVVNSGSILSSLSLAWTLVSSNAAGTTNIVFTDPIAITGGFTIDGLAATTATSGGYSLQQQIFQAMIGLTTVIAEVYLLVGDHVVALTTPTITNPIAKIDLASELLEVYFKSNINIQNRTKTDSGSTSMDAVDNQPLKGMKYEFIGGVPQVKERSVIGSGYAAINRIVPNRGMNLIRGADLTGSRINYREPPTPKVFNNIKTCAAINLDPGQCKMSTITSVWKGYATNLIQFKFTVRPTTINTDAMRFMPGKCEMFALEERISTPSLNLITCLYEVQQTVGVKLTGTKKKISVSNYQTASYSNAP